MTEKRVKGSTGPDYTALSANDKEGLQRAIKKGATRREAIQMMVAAGMTAAAAGSIVTTATEALAMTPKKGGKLRVGTALHGPDDTLDPVRLTSETDYGRARAHYNSLVQLNDDIVPQPELAESFEANKDASEWTFSLRKDVKFHDGSKFTADDVVWSLSRHLGKDSKSVAKGLMTSVKEWKKVGPYEVKAICDAPYSDLPAVLGEKHFKIAKADTKDFATAPGTGPFKLKNFRPGVGSHHVRNDDYWREGANIDEFEIFGITDPVARVNALIAGDIHLMNVVPPKAMNQVEKAEGVTARSVPSGSYMGICIHATHGEGKNADFVNGMKHIMRRERIVKNILRGHGTVGNDHPINVAYGRDFCDTLPVAEFDPEKAKALFKKSGLTGAEVQVAEVAGGVTDTMLLVQRECQKIGFNLQIKKVPTDGYWGAVWQKTAMNVTAWNMRPTATIMLDLAYAPGAPWSDTEWKDDRMGELLAKAKAETDPKIKHELLCEMQKIVALNAPVVIPSHRNIVDGISDKVKGVPRLALGGLGASEWPEFVWLDA
ncbi:MAG: ABC transporter substrate-binding protein [Pseudomonadota bacterium]